MTIPIDLIVKSLAVSQIVSYTALTIYGWFIYWRKKKSYSLYDVLFHCTMEDDINEFYDILAITRHMPIGNIMLLIGVLCYLIVRFFLFLISPLKNIRFGEVENERDENEIERDDTDKSEHLTVV